MIAAAMGALVIAVDIDDQKLELAKTLGANFTLNAQHGEFTTTRYTLTFSELLNCYLYARLMW